MSEFDPMTCRHSLNGFWDFLPVYGDPGEHVPKTGWKRSRMRVPSFWTKPTDAVRLPGETRFSNQPDLFKRDRDWPRAEFLFDAFGYPNAWSRTRCAWLRRKMTLPSPHPERRILLQLDALMPKGTLFVNGIRVITHAHPALPLETDITPFSREGENEIAVLIEDYDRDAGGRPLVPTGNWIPLAHCGIWQDVRWIERHRVHVRDVTLRTSVRKKRLEILLDVRNESDRERRVTLRSDVRVWSRGRNPERAPVELALPTIRLTLQPGQTVSRHLTVRWPDAPLWQPESPTLHTLRTELAEGERILHVAHERFGFREVWIDGPDLMLNGYPIHLFSDWGHKLTPYYYHENWIRQWFGMMRDANVNHTRLHTHPHPRLILDMADEAGILVTGETGLHGSSGGLAGDEPAFWHAARDHIRRFVRRDRNHPSLVLWSVENEMRWLGAKTRLLYEHLPELRRLFETLDPTRPAYHEGDSSLWNESDQPMISRHYQKSCSGIGWWTRRQPLHAGEMALYHYAGPNNLSHLAGDRAWADYRTLNEAAATDAALIIETARTLGVCCLGPWNLSCLENLRPESRRITLHVDDETALGVKPLQVPAHSSEFTFWKKGKGYAPNYSFPIQKRAFRPFAVVDRSLRTGYFAGTVLRRELFVINDTPGSQSGWMDVRLERRQTPDRPVFRKRIRVTVGRGMVVSRWFQMTLPDTLAPGSYVYRARFNDGKGKLLDAWSRTLRITKRRSASASPSQKRLIRDGVAVAVWGDDALVSSLNALGVRCRPVRDASPSALTDSRLLVVGRNMIAAGSRQNQQLQAFIRKGGRVLLLEQSVSVFQKMPMVGKPLQKVFTRAFRHPVFTGLRDADLAFWGDDPYPLLSGDADVVKGLYRKDDSEHALFLADGDEGGFGNGGLGLAAMMEVREGDGVMLACQLRITDCMATIPAAERVLVNALSYLSRYQAPHDLGPLVLKGKRLSAKRIRLAVESARAGRSVLVFGPDAAALQAFGDALNVRLKPCTGTYYQAVRAIEDCALNGISNEDTCGIFTFSYAAGASNRVVATEALKPAPGLEALLQTPSKSGLEEFFVHGGMSEPLRAYTATRLRMGRRPPPLVLLGRVRVGHGQVLFNPISPPPDSPPCLFRLEHRLRAALGELPEGSALDGPSVPEGIVCSPGYPQMLHMRNAGADDAVAFEAMLEATRYVQENTHSTPVLGMPGWRTLASEDGRWTAEDWYPGRILYAYSLVLSPVSRKDVSSNLDVPNPEILTFLKLRGHGQVDVALNGVKLTSRRLEGETLVSDVALEAGGNHLLIRWLPSASDAGLFMCWQDIQKRPETGLAFR